MWILILLVIDVFSLINCETVAGLILARGGSKGIPLKNLQEVGGVSLLRRTILTAKAADLSDITVATDHPLIALEAYRSNASVFKRSSVTATDWAPSIWGVSEFLAQRPDVEILALLQVTSPFLKSAHVKGALRKINLPKPFDCVFTVTRSYKLRWHINDGLLEPLNFQASNRPRRQDWLGELLETGSFYITRRHVLDNGHFQNHKAVCRLPPKRVVVGGGSTAFVRKRRAALQRWLTIAARHPVIGHDADLRAFLCEPRPKLEKPRHDEFELAGTQTHEENEEVSLEEMEASFLSDQEQLRLMQLGLGRLEQIFERAEQRCAAEASDIRELGAALVALAAPAARDSTRWARARRGLKQAAEVAVAASEEVSQPEEVGEGAAEEAVASALEALGAARELGARLRRGLHAERAAAARAANAAALRRRHRYALRAAAHEAAVGLAYALCGVERAGAALGAAGAAHARLAALWGRLHAAATAH